MALVAAVITIGALSLAVATRRYERRLQDQSGESADLTLKQLPPTFAKAKQGADRQQAQPPASGTLAVPRERALAFASHANRQSNLGGSCLLGRVLMRFVSHARPHNAGTAKNFSTLRRADAARSLHTAAARLARHLV